LVLPLSKDFSIFDPVPRKARI